LAVQEQYLALVGARRILCRQRSMAIFYGGQQGWNFILPTRNEKTFFY